MQNSKTDIRAQIERTRSRLNALFELDQLESEFRLIENEYRERREVILAKIRETGDEEAIPALLTAE